MKLLDQSAKTNWKFIAIIAFVAVFLAGGILMLIPQFQEQTPPLPQQNNSQIDTSGPPSNSVEGWQTYRSEEFGFEVKYPNSFIVREQLGGSDYGYLTKFFFEDSLDPNFFYRISIEIRSSGQFVELWFENWKSKLIGHVTDRINSETTFQGDGYKGRKLVYDISDSGKNISFTSAILDNGKYLYAIESRSELVDQILATFRFVE